jgi:hypothetical protein
MTLRIGYSHSWVAVARISYRQVERGLPRDSVSLAIDIVASWLELIYSRFYILDLRSDFLAKGLQLVHIGLLGIPEHFQSFLFIRLGNL